MSSSLPIFDPDPPCPASRHDPNLGRIIQGRYRILSRIAAGGMAVAYRAEQAPLGRTCAIKLLPAGWDRSPRMKLRERIFLEASVAARLTSPHTVRIFDFGCDRDEPFIATEYVEGTTIEPIFSAIHPIAPACPGALPPSAQHAQPRRQV